MTAGGDGGGSEHGDVAGGYTDVEVEDIEVEGVFVQELDLPDLPYFDLGKINYSTWYRTPC